MTTEDEHLSMEAAGATDAEIQAVIHSLANTRHLSDTQLDRLLAYLKEEKNRTEARFRAELREMGIDD